MCWYIITGKFPSKLSANRTNTNQFTFKMCGSNYKTYQQCLLQLVLYPVVLWGYCLYVKWLVLVSPKILEFNASTLLEKALKALPSHFKFEQTFVFFAFYYHYYFFGHQSLGANTILAAVSKSCWVHRWLPYW